MKRRERQPGFRRNRNPVTWLLRHAQMSLSSLGRLSRNPVSSLMTAAVIGIALALPSGLNLVVENVRTVSGGWDSGASISLFLHQTVSDEQAAEVARLIGQRPDVAETRLIGSEQALREFRQLSGFGAALDLLDHNPLPAVVLAIVFLTTSVLAVIALLLAIGLWRKRAWSTGMRSLYTAFSLVAAAFIPFLAYWNLLGFQW